MSKDQTKSDDQYNFWGIGNGNDDPWDALHAHFQSLSRKDDAVVEETTVTGKGAPKR